jgi:hypothetical protein
MAVLQGGAAGRPPWLPLPPDGRIPPPAPQTCQVIEKMVETQSRTGV